MKKTILAMAVPAMMAAGATQAVELYNDGTNSFTVGGRINLKAESRKEADGERRFAQDNQSSRINFQFKRQLSDNVQARATLEYAMRDPQKNVDTSFTNRLGFVALDHADFGSVTFGKQWSTYYEVAGATDVFWVYGGSALGIYDNGGDARGTARADEAIKYDLSLGNLDLSAMYQFSGDLEVVKDDYDNILSSNGRDNSYAFAATYDFDFGLGFGAAFHRTNYENNVFMAPTPESMSTSDFDHQRQYVLNTNYTLGNLFAAYNFAETRNVTSEKAHGHELAVTYDLPMGIQLIGGFNLINDKTAGSDDSYSEYIFGGMYNWNSVLFYAEYAAIEDKSAGRKTNDNKGAVGVRYHF
ncbi:porin [Aliagarivorans marinus]|uniref:porin n=1 Tax=Aliagarivorans marinus TaxID=561965 RepID=UPI000684D94B|nr:porin [Aliagarivorans marinus]